MNKIFEILMLLLFGISWPVSIIKTVKVKKTGSKSIVFLTFIMAGYLCGIVNKIINGADYVIIFYSLNFVMVGIDAALYLKYRKREKE